MTTETLGPTLSASIVGASAGPLTQTIDARWLMAYNAALSDALPRPVAHPLFAVCYEWPVSAALRERAIGAAIASLSVHASHDLVVHRPPRAGDRLTTTGAPPRSRGPWSTSRWRPIRTSSRSSWTP